MPLFLGQEGQLVVGLSHVQHFLALRFVGFMVLCYFLWAKWVQ
jgi:hypothetical protein